MKNIPASKIAQNLQMSIRQLVLVFLSFGCGVPTSADVEAKLMAELSSASTIYHVGCDAKGRCTDPKRTCVGDALTIANHQAMHGSVAVEWEAPMMVPVGSLEFYWFIDSNGGGRFYYLEISDMQPSDCGSYCGWHVDNMPAGSLLTSNAELQLAPRSNLVITNFDRCGYP